MSTNYKIGDTIKLQGQTAEVVECIVTGRLMVNLDEDEVRPGDLATLKKEGILISHPGTKRPVCILADWDPLKEAKAWWNDEREDDDDFFDSAGSFLGGYSTGGFSGGSFGGGFGGFGGGGFGGGGVGRSF